MNMFPIGAAFIAAGYALVYWGADNIRNWMQIDNNSSLSLGTQAVPLSVLVGVKGYDAPGPGVDPDTGKAGPLANNGPHPVPFPYKAPENLRVTPSSNTTPGGGNGAQLSPNFPGGTGTIPTPGIPGKIPPSGGAYV